MKKTIYVKCVDPSKTLSLNKVYKAKKVNIISRSPGEMLGVDTNGYELTNDNGNKIHVKTTRFIISNRSEYIKTNKEGLFKDKNGTYYAILNHPLSLITTKGKNLTELMKNVNEAIDLLKETNYD